MDHVYVKDLLSVKNGDNLLVTVELSLKYLEIFMVVMRGDGCSIKRTN